jgi:hypothetical protein
MDRGLELLCGLSLDGARLTEVEDLDVGQAIVGCGVFGPSGLLRDLELRLGLVHLGASHSVRVARWSARLAALAPLGRFYSRSYDVDAWGTASELLRMRDLLVDAGWDGTAPHKDGDRVSQLSEVETHGDTPLPPGVGDRLRSVAGALDAGGSPGYMRIRTVEPVALWSHHWQKVFLKLMEGGCRVEPVEVIQSQAPATSDLGRMQRHLISGGDFVTPAGDGTLVFLRGETVWETAHATAGLLRAWQGEQERRAVVIRSGDALPLDLALARAGLPTQGIFSPSRLRPLLQVLPLTLELAFEPKDPYRILELLALPQGPFQGIVADQLADALAEMPGLGSEAWQKAKAKAADLIRTGILSKDRPAGTKPAETDAEATSAIEKAMRKVANWIEAPGHPQAAAPRDALLAVVERVKKWLQGQIIGTRKDASIENEGDPADHDESLLQIAYGHAAALAETLTADPRTTLGLVQVRQLVEAVVGSGGTLQLRDEEAGRIDHVDSAAAILRPRGTVLWWGCTSAAAEAPRPLPFSRAEHTALAAVGVHLGDARAEMAETAAAWRRAALAASDRFVLVAPRFERGEAVAVHPFWDELSARMGGKRHVLSRVNLGAQDVLHGKSPLTGFAVDTEDKAETSLPASRPEWLLPAKHLGRGDRASASSIETLLGCPLRWTLHYRAGLRSGSMVTLPEDHRLYGTLGHRLVELLHQGGAFKLKSAALHARTLATLDDILPREGATLLLPGRRGELAQLRQQLATAVLRLADLLHRSQLEIVEVEKEERIDWQGRELEGHLDVLLRNQANEDVVLDLKWGRTTYVDKLRNGTSVQLAVYAYLRKRPTGAKGKAFPAVAYFSLSRGICLATDNKTFDGTQVFPGDDAEGTWKRTEVTLKLIEAQLDKGRVPVAGVSDAPPVVQACGGDGNSPKHLLLAPDAACQYCEFDPICGRRWEAQR